MAVRAQAFEDGTHEALRQTELAQIALERRYDAGLAQHKRQQAQARESKQHQATDWDQLTKLDRYERRAVSRCDRAIKAFDWACAAQHAANEPFAAIWQNEPNAEDTEP
jgi:hypothetical protein